MLEFKGSWLELSHMIGSQQAAAPQAGGTQRIDRSVELARLHPTAVLESDPLPASPIKTGAFYALRIVIHRALKLFFYILRKHVLGNKV